MGIISRIFATPEAIEKTVDAAISAGDKIWYTEEEKAEGKAALNEWYLRYLEATAGHNLARRYIAMVITGVWAAVVLAALASYPFSSDYSDYSLSLLEKVVVQPYSLVVSFYFMKQIVDSYRGPKK